MDSGSLWRGSPSERGFTIARGMHSGSTRSMVQSISFVDKSGFYYSRPFCMCIKKTERFFIDTNKFTGLCCILSGSMSVDTAQIFAVVSLLMKVHSEENAMDLKGIVHLLEKMVLFPELESHRRELQGFLEEAKCQVKC